MKKKNTKKATKNMKQKVVFVDKNTLVVTNENIDSIIDHAKEALAPYEATINIMGKNYKATGQTISEAIAGLKPQNCKGKGILTIQRGEVKKDRIIMPVATFRLFNTHGLGREVAIKNVSNLFNGI